MLTDSEFFTVAEMLVTSSGLDNTPPDTLHGNINSTMVRMDKVRSVLGKPVRITSGFRSAAVNSAIGGSPTSAHTRGLAADFVCANQDPAAICRQIIGAQLEFDQLIAEYHNGRRWVHIGFDSTMRRQVLTFREGRYLTGLQPASA